MEEKAGPWEEVMGDKFGTAVLEAFMVFSYPWGHEGMCGTAAPRSVLCALCY